MQAGGSPPAFRAPVAAMKPMAKVNTVNSLRMVIVSFFLVELSTFESLSRVETLLSEKAKKYPIRNVRKFIFEFVTRKLLRAESARKRVVQCVVVHL